MELRQSDTYVSVISPELLLKEVAQLLALQ